MKEKGYIGIVSSFADNDCTTVSNDRSMVDNDGTKDTVLKRQQINRIEL